MYNSKGQYQKPTGFVTKKDGLLFSIIVWLWICSVFYFNPRLLVLLVGPQHVIAKISAVLFIICLDIFWFYAILYMSFVTLSYFHKYKAPLTKPLDHPHPKVAVLYVTHNDFQADAAVSCLNQDYDNFHTFILDDSTDNKYIRAIDEFANRFNSRITIIRRPNHDGFKAGNLNNALSRIAPEYEYFAIADSDSVFPSDFITKTLPYFSLEKKIGFVQALHAVNPAQKSYFAKAMSYGFRLHYNRYLLPKERYGFVMFYGHGGMVKTSVWEEVGGFPEIVSEDLAFSAILRRYDYAGVLAGDVVCYEDYPSSYINYRRRLEKWIKGTLEFLFKEYRLFRQSSRVSWAEKLDILASGLGLTLGLIFLLFLIVGGLAIPISFNYAKADFVWVFPGGDASPGSLINLRYDAYWTWDIYLMTLITICYPLIPVFIDLVRKPGEMFIYMAYSTYLFFSNLVWASVKTLSYLLSRKAHFLITAHGSSQKNTLPLAVEATTAIVFFYIMLMTKNLWLTPVCAALFVSPLLYRWDFKVRPMRYLVIVPFILTLILIFLLGKSIIR